MLVPLRGGAILGGLELTEEGEGMRIYVHLPCVFKIITETVRNNYCNVILVHF